MIQTPNNATIYLPADIPRLLSDVLLNDVSVWDLGVQEVRLEEDGSGYVVLENKLPSELTTSHNRLVDGGRMIDNQILTLIYRGQVTIVPV